MSDASLPEEERQRGARRRAKSHDARVLRGVGGYPASGATLPVVAAGEKSVRVVCRLRPMSEREKRTGTVPVATASTERREVAVARVLAGGTRQVRSTFGFDDVLTSFSTQEDVFDATLAPLVDEVLAGYEATAFAYGQTGTGKTYTMEGDLETDEGRGLVPRTAAAVIGALASEIYTEYSITCSYLEIYNEELSDLLAPVNQPAVKLDLKDVPGKGVCCMGLSEVSVESVDEILALVHRAQERRRVAETRVNARSSRSHCLFTMRVRCRRTVNGGEMENSGKLHLVDLAGSECAKTASGTADAAAGKVTPATPRGGETERERKNINQSLLTLGRVITALRDGSGRVPYRDSKLTRLLQDALGGRCKTVVIATISPAMSAVEETISTLTYAEQASGIKNKPVASSLMRTAAQGRPGDSSSTSAGCGSNDWAELEMKVVYLTQEVEEAQAALARKYREAQDLASQITSMGEKLDSAESALQSARRSVEEGAFVRARVAEVAEQRREAASQLSGALDAAMGHAGELARLLGERGAWAAEARLQARGVLSAAEAELEALATSTAAGVQEVAAQLQAARAAHCAAAEAAGDVVQEQRRLLAEALGSARAGGARLRELLGLASTDAVGALEAEHQEVCCALDLVEAAMATACAEAAKVGTVAAAAAAHGDELFGARAGAVCEELASGREALEADQQAAARDLAEARRAACAAHEASEAHLEGKVRNPQHELVGLLEAASGSSEGCRARCEAARSEAATASGAAAARRAQLRESLSALQTDQAASAAAGPPRLAAAVAALRSALASRGPEAAAALDAVDVRLREATDTLSQHAQQSKEGMMTILGSTKSKLTAHWECEREAMDAVGVSLAGAARRQRDGNAAEKVQRTAIETEAALATDLNGSVQSLQVWRDNIVSQIAELQEQRAAEERATALLRQQREALQADASAARGSLEKERAELDACRAELEALRSSQDCARRGALEAIVGAVTRELDGMGRALGDHLDSAGGSLRRASELSGSASRAAAAAEERGVALGHEVSDVVADWSKAIGIRCGALSAAQERSREVERGLVQTEAAAAQRLRDLGELSATWGDCCEEVASTIDDVGRRCSAYHAAAAEAQPQWQAALEQASQAAEVWASEGGRHVDEALAAVASRAQAAGGALGALREEGRAQVDAAAEQQAAWDADGSRLGASLAGLACCASELDREDRGDGERHGLALDGICKAAAVLADDTREAHAASGAVLRAVAARLEALPGERRAGEAALGAAAEALEEMSSKAVAALGNASEAVEGLRAAQCDTTQAVRESAAEAAGAAEAAVQGGIGAARKHREALGAAAARASGRWRAAEESCGAALAEVDAAADRAGVAAAAAAQAGSERIFTELEGGCKSQTRASTAVEGLGGRITAVLGEHGAGLRRGLSAAPLSALAEEEQARLPAGPRRPEVLLPPMPSEQQLLDEFRGAGGKSAAPLAEQATRQASRDGQENIPASGPAGKKPTAAGCCEAPRAVLADANRLE